MCSLKLDSEHFAFLDELRDSGTVNTVLAASYLVREFPGLRVEEAKAICADWRVAYHERRVSVFCQAWVSTLVTNFFGFRHGKTPCSGWGNRGVRKLVDVC